MEKICTHCGQKVNEGEKFCQNCGASTEDAKVINENQNQVVQNVQNSINNNINTNQTSDAVKGKTGTNGLAVAGFVCSLVGLFLFGIWMGIIAISFSLTAKKQMKVFTNQKGQGLATAALVIGIVDVALTFIGIVIKYATLF